MPGPAFRHGASVALCPVEEEDLAFCKRLRNDPDTRWEQFAATPTNDQSIEEWFEELSKPDTEAASFLVVPDESDEPVGYVELSGVERPASHATVDYCIAPDEQGNGYAVAALDLLVDYAIAERRLHRVRTTALADDSEAHEALEVVGFVEEETRREERYVDGAHRDVVSYAVLEPEWGDA
ncbi:GNAT family N-acetyltransferase [Halorarius litoreus]|uniref:GNAT family N-acetyltransferase n=1 Tax=Halorarius litoreus TaxID=2962676 RepID=UPI0020CD953B|nr:GNAT family protein [Halorarius litoreus]